MTTTGKEGSKREDKMEQKSRGSRERRVHERQSGRKRKVKNKETRLKIKKIRGSKKCERD